MKLTPRAKQGLVLFGQHGLISIISGTLISAGIIFGVVKTWGQTLIVTPVVKAEVKEQVDAAKQDCQNALSKHVEEAKDVKIENDKRFEKQSEINQKILDKLSEIAETTAEIKGNVDIMKRRGQ